MFPGVGGIWLEKTCIWMGVLALGRVSLFTCGLAGILSKTEKGLYGISPIARLADCIFRAVIPCYLDFCIKAIKSALSMLQVVNCIF